MSVESQQEFDLAGVPSGQNLFLMWKSSTPGSSDAIIATGINPANTSLGQALTAYETVNTGQGGGNTTLSNTSQAGLVAYTGYGTSLVYTFVKETNANFTVPQADQTEVDLEQNIKFAVVMARADIAGDPDQLSGIFTIAVEGHPTITFNGNGKTLEDLIDFVGQIEDANGYVELEIQGGQLVVKTFGDTVTLSGFSGLAPALNGTFNDSVAESAGTDSKGVSFTVVQVGGGEEATVKVTLIDRDDVRSGEDYVDGIKKITTVATTSSSGTLKLSTPLTPKDTYTIKVDLTGNGNTTGKRPSPTSCSLRWPRGRHPA